MATRRKPYPKLTRHHDSDRYEKSRVLLHVSIPERYSDEKHAWEQFCEEHDLPLSALLRRGFRLLVETVRRHPHTALARELVKPWHNPGSRFDGPLCGTPEWTDRPALWAGIGERSD